MHVYNEIKWLAKHFICSFKFKHKEAEESLEFYHQAEGCSRQAQGGFRLDQGGFPAVSVAVSVVSLSTLRVDVVDLAGEEGAAHDVVRSAAGEGKGKNCFSYYKAGAGVTDAWQKKKKKKKNDAKGYFISS